MANGHSRNKRGRGNPRARHGPAPQPRPTAGRALPSTGDPASAAPTARIPDATAHPPTEGTPPPEQGTRPTTPPARRGQLASAKTPSPRQRVRASARPPRAAGWNGANSANRATGEAPASMAPIPPKPPTEIAPPTEEAPDRTAEPTPRPISPASPISRERGWRALPPRGARAREDRAESAPPIAGPPTSQPTSWVEREDAPPEPMELAAHLGPLERAPQRPPNGIAAPNGHAPFRPEVRGALGPLIDSLHELFAHDRAVASQGGIARCGICYLHHPLDELEYREAEGFYVCPTCQRALGHTSVNMIRRQQR